MFVIVLAISAPALADDLNPPDWALGPGTIYGIWEFPSEDSGQEGDYPEVGEMVPHATNPDPEEMTGTSDPDEVAHQYMEVSYTAGATWVESHEGREGVVSHGMSFWASNFPGACTKLIRLQVTWTGSEISIFYIGAGGGTYTGPVEWFPSAEDVWIETVDLGDGWSHSTYEFLLEGNPYWEWVYVGAIEDGTIYLDQIVIDTICYPDAEPPDGPGREVVIPPITVDPNVMLVYETGATVGDFDIRLKNQLPTGKMATVTVDANNVNGVAGRSEDITLIGGSGPNGSVTMIFDANNWDVPQTVAFKAIDDLIAEPQETGDTLIEPQSIVLTSVYSETLQDPNWAGEKVVRVNVKDNDQPDILLTITPAEQNNPKSRVTGPVQLWEQGRLNFYTKWRKIGVTLQLPPLGYRPVKLQAVVEEVEYMPGGDNLPLTDPCLPYEEIDDPNGMIFTAENYDVSQPIKIWGNDDDVLQAEDEEGDYPSADGDQNYHATVVVTVVDDGGDDRYTDMVRTVDIDIQDNECGAFGVVPVDVSNPYYLMDEETLGGDPNDWVDEDGNPLPDCYVDIYDVIEFATEWLDCSDPQKLGCESYL